MTNKNSFGTHSKEREIKHGNRDYGYGRRSAPVTPTSQHEFHVTGIAMARISFINKIAAPVLNKMFDCGMIP
jgi:hypothetical protein